MKHAWYSEKQRTVYGLFRWSTQDGGSVECTSVSDEYEGAPMFDDTRYMGEVEEHVATLELHDNPLKRMLRW